MAEFQPTHLAQICLINFQNSAISDAIIRTKTIFPSLRTLSILTSTSAVLPGILIDACNRSSKIWLNRRVGSAIGLTISIALHIILNTTWGVSGNRTVAVVAIVSYYAFRKS